MARKKNGLSGCEAQEAGKNKVYSKFLTHNYIFNIKKVDGKVQVVLLAEIKKYKRLAIIPAFSIVMNLPETSLGVSNYHFRSLSQ